MAKKSEVKMDLTQLKTMASGLQKLADNHYVIQVGIFGDKGARKAGSGPTNAEIGFVHEMGSVTRHIPRRSFLMDTFTQHANELMAVLKPSVEALFKKGKVDEYLKQAGIAATNLVVEAFQTSGWGAWPANAYSTLMSKLRGSLIKRKQLAAEVMFEGATHAKPLIKTGQLWQSVSFRTARS